MAGLPKAERIQLETSRIYRAINQISYWLTQLQRRAELTVARAAHRSSHPAECRIFNRTYSRTLTRIVDIELHAMLVARSVHLRFSLVS